ncbi:MAG: hypothetical protein Q4B58_08820, partial [Bacteroidales bacterium]|nr:hypothetical protein [Bacteroidales bacterium]
YFKDNGLIINNRVLHPKLVEELGLNDYNFVLQHLSNPRGKIYIDDKGVYIIKAFQLKHPEFRRSLFECAEEDIVPVKEFYPFDGNSALFRHWEHLDRFKSNAFIELKSKPLK